MVQRISVRQEIERTSREHAAQPGAKEPESAERTQFITLPFFYNGTPLLGKGHPRWGMTLLAAGSMRFRWNETNEARERVLGTILGSVHEPARPENCTNSSTAENGSRTIRYAAVELIHSQTVVAAEKAGDTAHVKADGIITKNPLLVPTITVADCVPIFLYDVQTGAFGVLHSGWKGTGIVSNGIAEMRRLYGSRPEHICAAIGPHINSCCYAVDKARADYFRTNFGNECITERTGEHSYRLSLTNANLRLMSRCGIRDENSIVADDCTCCAKFASNRPVFGSFRRQAAFLPTEITPDERSRRMTVQAAFVLAES